MLGNAKGHIPFDCWMAEHSHEGLVNPLSSQTIAFKSWPSTAARDSHPPCSLTIKYMIRKRWPSTAARDSHPLCSML